MNKCNKCQGEVLKMTPKRKIKPGQKFYYRFYYQCVGTCKAQHMPKEEIVYIDRDKQIKHAFIQWEQLGKTLKGLMR